MQKSHIYYSRRFGNPVKIKLLCNDKRVEAEEEATKNCWAGNGYKIDGVHQWSIGAGHNADCPQCLIKYAERKMKTDRTLLLKIIKMAKGQINDI